MAQQPKPAWVSEFEKQRYGRELTTSSQKSSGITSPQSAGGITTTPSAGGSSSQSSGVVSAPKTSTSSSYSSSSGSSSGAVKSSFDRLGTGIISTPSAGSGTGSPIDSTHGIIFTPPEGGFQAQNPHQQYIHENLVGGLPAYQANQMTRFQEAMGQGDADLAKRLVDDSMRVGYSLTSKDLPPSVQQPIQQPKLPDYSWIADMVNRELALQRQAIQQELARLQQANQLAVQQNNQFLQEQIADLERNRIQAGAEIERFQNRRGGFYSGGLDYQLATNRRAFTEAQESVTRDIAARNADIWNRNALLAQQAAERLSQLEQQAPIRIQQLIREQMERDRAFALQEAGLTGSYQGQPTLAAQNQMFNQALALGQFGLQERAQEMSEMQIMAQLTGFLPDGTPTNAYLQQQLENEWRIADVTGRITPYLAQLYGLPENTPTMQAKQLAIQQQQANTSAFSAQTSRMNLDLTRQRQQTEQNAQAIQAQIVSGISQFNSAEQARAWLNANAGYITQNLGSSALQQFHNMIPLFYGEDTSQQQAQSAARIRQQAIDMATKDNRWLDPNQNKEALIQEYIRYLTGG